jgi:hypothetical protein
MVLPIMKILFLTFMNSIAVMNAQNVESSKSTDEFTMRTGVNVSH